MTGKMIKTGIVSVLLVFAITASAQQKPADTLLLNTKQTNFISLFKVPDASFYSPKIEWSKSRTYTFSDGKGGYYSYSTYGNYLTMKQNYNFPYDFPQNKYSTINYPAGPVGVGAALLHGILRDVLDLGPIKMGKSKVDW